MLTNLELEKDEIQLKKAKMKVVAVNSLIPELIRLNDELSIEDVKPYTVLLDYDSRKDFYNFIVDIRRNDKVGEEATPLLRVHFGLKDINEGLKLFDEVRDCFMENSDVSYTSFKVQNKGQMPYCYNIVGKGKITLQYNIHNPYEYATLLEYNNALYEKKENVKTLKLNNNL